LILAGILVLLGLVWIGQGSGMLAGSAMSGSSFWEIVGVVLVIVGIVLVILEWRRGQNVRS
jgi:hypothetical protein